MIHYNSNHPDHMKARKEVKPLSEEEIKDVLEAIEQYIISVSFTGKDAQHITKEFDNRIGDKLQRLIYHYENLRHFYDVVGGWEGVDETKNQITIEEYLKDPYSPNNSGKVLVTGNSSDNDTNVVKSLDWIKDADDFDEIHIVEDIDLETGKSKTIYVSEESEKESHENDKLLDAAAEVLSELETGKATTVESKWISVKDRLPVADGEYLVVANRVYRIKKDGETTITRLSKIETQDYRNGMFEKDWLMNEVGNKDIVNHDSVREVITHWQPLPEPPKE